MHKIVLITCYFGKFPWYFNLFLKSCRYNPTVDFLIFSNSNPECTLPDNVTVVPFDIGDFNQLATRKLELDIHIRSAYKLCDFKPAYGTVFSEYIQGYDFWGITDIDIVFGRIREFMTAELLNAYDVISVRDDYPTGSFMLFKNVNSVNRLYARSRDYQKVFTSDRHYCFDECNFKHYYLQEGGDIFETHCDIESMHHVIKKEEKKGLKAHFDFLIIEGLPGELKWDRGVLSFKNEYEVLLHHLILYKANRYTRKKIPEHIPDTFYIDKYMIRRYRVRSLRGSISHFVYNRFLPALKKAIFWVDSFISHKSGRKMKGLRSGTYELNGTSMCISINYKGENQISFNGIQPVSLVKSVCYPDSFYSHIVKNVRCRITNNETLTEYHINGGMQTFKSVNIMFCKVNALQADKRTTESLSDAG